MDGGMMMGFHQLPNGDLSWGMAQRYMRYDMMGKEVYNRELPRGYIDLSHEVMPLKGDHLLLRVGKYNYHHADGRLSHTIRDHIIEVDGSGKVVVSSMPVVKASAKSYKLRVTCKTTKADIDSGKAAIEKVLVATSDGKVHTITVNKKLKDIGKPGHPGNPGNPGQPGQPDNPGDSKGGGGCDAGVGGLALALVGAFLLRRKA